MLRLRLSQREDRISELKAALAHAAAAPNKRPASQLLSRQLSPRSDLHVAQDIATDAVPEPQVGTHLSRHLQYRLKQHSGQGFRQEQASALSSEGSDVSQDAEQNLHQTTPRDSQLHNRQLGQSQQAAVGDQQQPAPATGNQVGLGSALLLPYFQPGAQAHAGQAQCEPGQTQAQAGQAHSQAGKAQQQDLEIQGHQAGADMGATWAQAGRAQRHVDDSSPRPSTNVPARLHETTVYAPHAGKQCRLIHDPKNNRQMQLILRHC